MNWHGRSVLITGHTGFKGGWLALYLASLGARVHGYGRGRHAGPAFFEIAKVRRHLFSHTTGGDVCDLVNLRCAVRAAQPSIVMHLAARAIVKDALDDPVGTISTNVVGSANVLQAASEHGVPVLVVTTDKVYRNEGLPIAFTETDRLGGLDPYGASKACVELLCDSYRHTYGLHVATARCANVIGGGDFGAHRLVPNCLKAFEVGEPVTAYDAVRVFLHVLDAVSGYVLLAEHMLNDRTSGAFNFGPATPEKVESVARATAQIWERINPGLTHVIPEQIPPARQARHLDIDSAKARALGWSPRYSTTQAIESALNWHRAWRDGADMDLVTQEQIRLYREAMARAA